MRFVVVYDACVLYPAPLRDLLIRLAGTGLFAAKWTQQIHDEWSRNLIANRPELAGKLDRTIDLMNRAVPDSLVDGHDVLIESLTLPDPDDRHVLAAAIMAGAQLIVTFNTRDFPDKALSRFGVEAVHPDDFISQQIDLHEGRILFAVKSHREALKNPPKNVDEYLDTLAANGLVRTVDRLREFRDIL